MDIKNCHATRCLKLFLFKEPLFAGQYIWHKTPFKDKWFWKVLEIEMSSNSTTICYGMKIPPQQYIWGPFYKHELSFTPTSMRSYVYYKLLDEITYPFLNFNGASVEVENE